MFKLSHSQKPVGVFFPSLDQFAYTTHLHAMLIVFPSCHFCLFFTPHIWNRNANNIFNNSQISWTHSEVSLLIVHEPSCSWDCLPLHLPCESWCTMSIHAAFDSNYMLGTFKLVQINIYNQYIQYAMPRPKHGFVSARATHTQARATIKSCWQILTPLNGADVLVGRIFDWAETWPAANCLNSPIVSNLIVWTVKY